jgi:hypothetical protein
MSEPEFTADNAYLVLRKTIELFLAGDVSATVLYDWLSHRYGVPKFTPATHPANLVWGQAVLNVAVFLQCDMDRSMLADSLQQILDWDGGGSLGFTPITGSRCFFELIKGRSVPAPIQIHTYDSIRLHRMAFEGFHEI